MACQSCNKNRVMSISGKCSDMCDVRTDGIDYDGYVPSNLNIGGGDYIEFTVCLDCGQMQGKFPVSETTVAKQLRRA